MKLEAKLCSNEDEQMLSLLKDELIEIKKSFELIHNHLGVECSDFYLGYLGNQNQGEDHSKPLFKRFVRYETLKNSYIKKITQNDKVLSQSPLDDQDIRLLT